MPGVSGGEVVVTSYAAVCSTSSFPQPLLTSSFPVLPSITMLPTLQYAPMAFDQQAHQPLTFQPMASSFPPPGFPLLSQASLLPSSFLPSPMVTSRPLAKAAVEGGEDGGGESSGEEDLHLCGACKGQFNSFTEFTRHRRSCAARRGRRGKVGKGQVHPALPPTNIQPTSTTTSIPMGMATSTPSPLTSRSSAPLTPLTPPDTAHCQPGPGSNPSLEANAVSLLANQFGEAGGKEGEELVGWQVEEGELGSEEAEEQLLCISVEQGAGEAVQYQPLHSLSLPSPAPSLLASIPGIQIQECTINFSLPDAGMGLEQDLLLPQASPPKLPTRNAAEATTSDSGGRKVHQCTFVGCLFTTKYSKDLTRHMTKHTGEKPFSCHLCGHSFGRQDKLNRHMQLHTGYKPFSCGACSYKAVDRCTLRKHMRVHTDERPYHCQICPYRSKDSSQLTVHLRTHTGDAPFSCQEPDCAATFKTNSDLTRHVRTHTGEKPYKCEYCDHRVKIKSNLKAHIRVNHRPNEVFKCRLETCDYVTSSRGELREHHKNHDSTTAAPDLLSCTFCNFTTNIRQKLASHAKEHDVARPYKCSYCIYSAKSQAILSSHVNKRHAAQLASKGKDAGRADKKSPKSKAKSEDTVEISKKERKTVLNKTNCKPNFSCPVCPAGFVRRDSLRSHVKQHQRAGVPLPALRDTYVGEAARENVIKVFSAPTSHQHVAVQLKQVFPSDTGQP